MNDSLQNLHRSIKKLEELIESKLVPQALDDEKVKLKSQVQQLEAELEKNKEEYRALKETSGEVINELNNSIQVIDDFFKRYTDVSS